MVSLFLCNLYIKDKLPHYLDVCSMNTGSNLKVWEYSVFLEGLTDRYSTYNILNVLQRTILKICSFNILQTINCHIKTTTLLSEHSF
jgi:hypothetical protein